MSLEGEHFSSPFLFQTLIKLFDRERKRNRLSLDQTSGFNFKLNLQKHLKIWLHFKIKRSKHPQFETAYASDSVKSYVFLRSADARRYRYEIHFVLQYQ